MIQAPGSSFHVQLKDGDLPTAHVSMLHRRRPVHLNRSHPPPPDPPHLAAAAEHGPHGGTGKPAGRAAWFRVSHHPGQHGQTQALGGLDRISTSAAAPSEMELALAAADGARLAEGRVSGSVSCRAWPSRLLVIGQQQGVRRHHGRQLLAPKAPLAAPPGPAPGRRWRRHHRLAWAPAPPSFGPRSGQRRCSSPRVLHPKRSEETCDPALLWLQGETASVPDPYIGGPGFMLRFSRHHPHPLPSRSPSAASITAFMPEPHTC